MERYQDTLSVNIACFVCFSFLSLIIFRGMMIAVVAKRGHRVCVDLFFHD